ncbi:transposase [Salipiger pacificus]|nr:transposase [Alloyangia pacifica]MCA0946123.1 transposase [Alloyangia pacifica]
MATGLARDLISDEEWTFFEWFILVVRAPNGRKPANHRLVLDGIFWIARTGTPWASCRRSSASGRASSANSGAGRWRDSGSRSWMH